MYKAKFSVGVAYVSKWLYMMIERASFVNDTTDGLDSFTLALFKT